MERGGGVIGRRCRLEGLPPVVGPGPCIKQFRSRFLFEYGVGPRPFSQSERNPGYEDTDPTESSTDRHQCSLDGLYGTTAVGCTLVSGERYGVL